MYFAGCDLGSTTGKVVILDDAGGEVSIAGWSVVPASYLPEDTAGAAFDDVLHRCSLDSLDDLTATCCTGYGRASVSYISDNVSEITCHARGARWAHPGARTIIDIGGQDVKAVVLSGTGKVLDFAMNDKCAAGTGKFFEVMANTLCCSLPELGELARRAGACAHMTSQCSVFAESEVIAYMNQGTAREDIAAGIHESIARRLFSMAERVGYREDVVLTGGCAKNEALRVALEGLLGCLLVRLPIDPQIVGALGAALFAREHHASAARRSDAPTRSTGRA